MDCAVLATAGELFAARHYPGVVALVGDALEHEPDSVPLLLLRARAHVGLRRDLDAQADLRDIIRLDPRCGFAYRLLGELAARRNENEPAAIFFREALRLDPDDREAADWLAIVEAPVRPAAVANKLPAPATAAGRSPHLPARAARSVDVLPRFARGSSAPRALAPEPAALPPPPRRSPSGSSPTLDPRVAPPAPMQSLRRPPSQPQPRPSLPEQPGFGDYLVSTGILSRERLRAAQAYQRSMKVQLATAIVTLGLASPQRIEWAAVAHQAQLR